MTTSYRAAVRRWVNKGVAHFERQEPKPPIFGELHRSVDVIFELFQKYANLIQGVLVVGDVVMTPWPPVFRAAWIPEEAWVNTMTETERVGREGL
jgi:hypothetical protein